MNTIYLDHAATSPVAPEVIDVFARALAEVSGNASSIHTEGRLARKALDEARATLAKKINAKPTEIIFTSGGTEADNTAILGTAYARQQEGKHIITSQIEHHAVLHACEKLEREGFEVTYLPVDKQGRVSVEDVQNALRDDTILVTIMYGNNEVGTIQPIAEIGALLQNHQATFHTDAVQAFGLETIDVKAMHIDLLSVSSHKINGPKGIGFLYVKQGVKVANFMLGGAQEKKRRAGTENVPAAVAFAKAAEISTQHAEERKEKYNGYKAILVEEFEKAQVTFQVNGHETQSLAHVLNVTFPGTNVESFLINLDMAGQ